MDEFSHRSVRTPLGRVHFAEHGPDDGQLVVMCHGFPESWYSWRHQLQALGDAGYRAVALDMRGYGRTHKPESVLSYTTVSIVADVVHVLDALGAESAVIVGHDHGAPVAWAAVASRPDRFHAVVALSVPLPSTMQSPVPPIEAMKVHFAGEWFYSLWFQEEGRAERILDANVEEFLRGFLYTLSGDCPGPPLRGLTGGGAEGDILSRLNIPESLPGWLSDEDLAHYVGEFERTGFRGGLNWYRCGDENWRINAGWQPPVVEQPALFIAGERDCVLEMMPVVERMAMAVPQLRGSILLPDCGHWTQQERPDEVNEAMINFLADLPR